MTTDPSSLLLTLPPDLLRQIKTYQEKTGIETAPAAILAILTVFLKTADNQISYAPLDRLEALEGKLQVWFSN